jgi:hypothetical protein
MACGPVRVVAARAAVKEKVADVAGSVKGSWGGGRYPALGRHSDAREVPDLSVIGRFLKLAWRMSSRWWRVANSTDRAVGCRQVR